MELGPGKKVLFLDAQTTGLSPRAGEIMELGFGIGGDPESFGSRLFKLRREDRVPPKVWKMTGLSLEQLEEADDIVPFWKSLVEKALAAGVDTVVIHYAQFELPFLKALHRETFGEAAEFPWPVLCTQRLAHKLFPNLPSRTLRALAGYFGFDLGESHRSLDHLNATRLIWEGCAEKLAGPAEPPPEKKRGAKKTREYLVDKQKRLDLPKGPGIYEMVSPRGKILYVGKATSLRDRVNSYFRGHRPERPKIKELMTQVADVRVTPTATPLEAALLEYDRIKMLEPPYNVSLRQRKRRLLYFSRDLIAGEGPGFSWGPFSSDMNFDTLEQIRALASHTLTVHRGYWLRHPPEAVFPVLEKMGLASWERSHPPITLNELFCLGKSLGEDPPDLDEVQIYVRRKLRQAVWRVHRAYWLVRLQNARVAWEYQTEGVTKVRFLVVRNGQVVSRGDGDLVDLTYRRFPTESTPMTVATFDRLRVLASGLGQQARKGKQIAVQFSPERVYDADDLLRLAGDHPHNPPELEPEAVASPDLPGVAISEAGC